MDEITTTLQRPRAAGGMRAGSGTQSVPVITDVLSNRPKPANLSSAVSTLQEQKVAVGFEGQLRITALLLKSVVEKVTNSAANNSVDFEAHAKALEDARVTSTIQLPKHLAAFLGQICVESGNFSAMKEKKAYIRENLLKTLGTNKGFYNLNILINKPPDENGLKDKDVAGKEIKFKDRAEQKIAELVLMSQEQQLNFLYEASGDGYKFRGRGHLQITGRWNYNYYGKGANKDLINFPEMLENIATSAEISVKFWDKKKLSKFAEKWDVDGISLIINVGGAHKPERKTASENALSLLDPNKTTSDQDWFIRAK
jgi:predicted chitinase